MIKIGTIQDAASRPSRKARLVRSLLDWFDANKRELPWRERRDAYSVWVSEVMLQQTQAETVAPYFERFMRLFPTLHALAEADETSVLKAWEGLGYYARARNLQKGARQVISEYGSRVPTQRDALRKICGIGDYTSGAILSQAYGLRENAVDGNVARVLARWFAVEDDIRDGQTLRRIRVFAQNLLGERPGDTNQALMELGALVCRKKPRCESCPVTRFCMAHKQDKTHTLPLRTPNKPQRTVFVAFALVYAGGRLLVVKRNERLLGGLYGFPMGEGETAEMARSSLMRLLNGLNLSVTALEPIGESKHVFTHRIWLMRGDAYQAEQAVSVPGGRWMTGAELGDVPMPAAMKMYRAWAYERACEAKRPKT